MKEFHVTVMSIDPDDHYGREQGDDSQKYGLTVLAENEEQAIINGKIMFAEDYGDLLIYWIKAYE